MRFAHTRSARLHGRKLSARRLLIVAKTRRACYNERMELTQLRQLVTIADEKVLSRAAEKMGISQSALSRSIQRLEDELGLALFERTKNSMALNEAGRIATEQARLVLEAAAALELKMGEIKSESCSISLATCAPAPQWKLHAELTNVCPKIKVASTMPDEDDIVSLLLSEKAEIAIVRKEIASDAIETVPFMDEQLFMQIPLSDPLSKKSEIHFSDLAGKEIREFTGIGFWHKLHREMIPDAKYIEYDDFMVFANVVKSQNPLTFVTELGHTLSDAREGCVTVPIVDDEATAHYRLAYLKKNKAGLSEIIEWATSAAKKW